MVNRVEFPPPQHENTRTEIVKAVVKECPSLYCVVWRTVAPISSGRSKDEDQQHVQKPGTFKLEAQPSFVGRETHLAQTKKHSAICSILHAGLTSTIKSAVFKFVPTGFRIHDKG